MRFLKRRDATDSLKAFPALVTKFHLQARPLPTHIYTSGYFYPKEDFEKAFNWVKDLVYDYDADTEIVCVGQYLPEFPESLIFVFFTVFKWSKEEAIAALQPAEDSKPSGAVLEWFGRPSSLPEQYVDQANANPKGHRYCCDNGYIENDADVANVLKDAFTTLPSRKAFSLWYAMAPTSRKPLPDMALSLHSDHYFALYTIWEDEKDDERCQAWVYNVMKGVAPHTIGAYLGDSDFEVRRTKYWSDENTKRLDDVRKKWDPEGRIISALE